jgi:hypothetical protein
MQDIDHDQNCHQDDAYNDCGDLEDAFSGNRPVQREALRTSKFEFTILADFRVQRANASAVWAGLSEHPVGHTEENSIFADRVPIVRTFAEATRSRTDSCQTPG